MNIPGIETIPGVFFWSSFKKLRERNFVMKRLKDRLFYFVILCFTLLTILTLAFVIGFIIHESMPLFQEVRVTDFIFGSKWMPIDYTGTTSFGIFNFIAGTIAVSVLAMFFSIVISLGCALWLSCAANDPVRNVIYPIIDLLAGIPSVIYGFIGLTCLVKLLLKVGVHTGSCVLAGAIVLAIMLFPYLISSCSYTILKMKERYLLPAETLGISRWYVITTIILPAAFPNILASMILAIGRAMGETMAVMMVMGNANLFPALLGKGETIASVIALEMGTAVAGSTHYHALYAAGMVLMIMLFVINIGIHFLQIRLERRL